MSLSCSPAPVRIATMAKQGKRSGGKHKTERKAVQVPVPWLALARKLAAKKKQPTLWFIIALIAEAADKEGEQCPTPPWEESEGGS